jgi:hypothetical protein
VFVVAAVIEVVEPFIVSVFVELPIEVAPWPAVVFTFVAPMTVFCVPVMLFVDAPLPMLLVVAPTPRLFVVAFAPKVLVAVPPEPNVFVSPAPVPMVDAPVEVRAPLKYPAN